jgi:hypothetical protein
MRLVLVFSGLATLVACGEYNISLLDHLNGQLERQVSVVSIEAKVLNTVSYTGDMLNPDCLIVYSIYGDGRIAILKPLPEGMSLTGGFYRVSRFSDSGEVYLIEAIGYKGALLSTTLVVSNRESAIIQAVFDGQSLSFPGLNDRLVLREGETFTIVAPARTENEIWTAVFTPLGTGSTEGPVTGYNSGENIVFTIDISPDSYTARVCLSIDGTSYWATFQLIVLG